MGTNRIAPDFGAVIVANHRSSVDPFFIQLAAGRRVHWMVASEYCRHFLFGPVLKKFQVIPTNRGGVDTAATKHAMAYAKSGKLVGMFPEGRINRTDNPLLPIRPGAGLVAIRAQVSIIPVWIEGSPQAKSAWEPFLKPAKVQIFIGKPFDCPVHSDDGTSDSNMARKWTEQAMIRAQKEGGLNPRSVELAGRVWSNRT